MFEEMTFLKMQQGPDKVQMQDQPPMCKAGL